MYYAAKTGKEVAAQKAEHTCACHSIEVSVNTQWEHARGEGSL